MKQTLRAALAIGIVWVTAVVLYATASYPSSVASFATRANGQTIDATWFDPLQDEVIAIENGLLNGIAHDLKPDGTATRSLGGSSLRWLKGWFTNLDVSGTTTLNTVAYTWPGSAGTNGQYLQTNGSGTLSWATASSASTITTTGATTSLAIPSGTGPLYLLCNNATDLTVQGITAGLDGQFLTLTSIGAGNVIFVHENGGTATGLKLHNIATSFNTLLAAGAGSAVYQYDATGQKWRLVAHEQGDYLDYGASSTIVGFSSTTAKVIKYYLRGRSVTVNWRFNGTSNSTSFTYTIPYTAGEQVSGAHQFVDNGTNSTTPGMAQTVAASATITLSKDFNAATWTASAGKQSYGSLTVQVQ